MSCLAHDHDHDHEHDCNDDCKCIGRVHVSLQCHVSIATVTVVQCHDIVSQNLE